MRSLGHGSMLRSSFATFGRNDGIMLTVYYYY
jgi:hypothetical protein